MLKENGLSILSQLEALVFLGLIYLRSIGGNMGVVSSMTTAISGLETNGQALAVISEIGRAHV